MLLKLSVRNFILIEKLDLEFDAGLCVITGETGAGKSILIDSLLFCLGGRFNNSIIKQGAENTIVTAEFTMNESLKPLFIANDFPIDETILIKRSQNLKNQKKFFVNDIPVTNKLLSDIANTLVDYHGQNQHNYLENINSHQKVLDSYAGLESIVETVTQKYKAWHAILNDLEQITVRRAQIEGEKSYLEFVVNELSKAKVGADEEDKLTHLRIELQQQAKQEQLVSDTLNLMTNQSFESKIMQMQKNLLKASDNIKFQQITELLDQALINYIEARDLLSSSTNISELEYKDLDEVEERLFFIKGLARKYNVSANSLNELLTDSIEKLDNINEKLENSELLRTRLESAKQEYIILAKELSDKRCAASLLLAEKINQELKALKMEQAFFKVEITTLAIEEARQTGIDNIRFLASTNPGTPPAPIDKIASGGELSRLMLAFKVIAPDQHFMPTMIFDEIDTGLGGIVASLIGERLKRLSNQGQVITISHQPQVAGQADQHILVTKNHTHNNTEVEINSLTKDARVQELARMLSGKQITKASVEAATELMV